MFAVAVAALASLAVVSQVDGHGFMYTPRSRNFIAWQDGVEGSQSGSYKREHCEDCLNTNVGNPLGYCGFSGNTQVDYTFPVDSVGQPMPWSMEIEYVEGQEIVIEHTYTAHHYGHVEVSVCPLGSSSTWECLEDPNHFLEFVSDELYGMPKDVNYPERGYLKRRAIGDPYTMKFKLPVGVAGDEVLLRWHYITANSCLPAGYDAYFSWAISNGLAVEADRKTGMTECLIPYERSGLKPSNDDPEQFWNCAEIAITPANPTKSPAPSISMQPTKAPVVSPAPTTASPVEPNPSGIPYPCCAWNGDEFCTQPTNDWCHYSENQCNTCNGAWKDPNGIPAPTVPAPTYPTPTVPAPPTDIPTTGIPCCSNNFKHCITWECNSCHQSEEHCLSAGNYHWMPWGEPIDDDSCIAITYSCVGHGKPCCPGMICNPDTSSAPCIVGTSAPEPTTAPEPTSPPVPEPTASPVTPAPTGPPTTPAPVTTIESELFSTDTGLNAYDAFLELTIDSLTYVVQQTPPVYALVASGGAAGSGDVVSESQAYALLTTGIVLASWDEQSSDLVGGEWDEVVTHFEGYYNGWKKMCVGSSVNAGCQSGGTWCYDEESSNNGVCLPGWKHSADLQNEVGTGSAPDGDVDAILGMILAIKAFESKATQPAFYDELRKWADASCSSFLYHNTVVQDGHRLVKLGSCWGGFGANGNNPSYHSPGSYKAMRDYHVAFPSNERSYSLPNYGSGSLESHWDQLIATSYETLEATQCLDFGMVPNWATVDVDGSGNMYHTGGSFTGSGTPQWEYGSEAARTTWRVALDAALFPNEMNEGAAQYLSPMVGKLSEGYNPSLSLNEKYFDANLFSTSSAADSCYSPGITSSEIYPFSAGWVWNAFIFAPTVSAAIAPVGGMSEPDQQAMVDSIGEALSSNIPTSYYPRCWTIIGLLTINGSVESAGRLLAGTSTPVDSPTAAPTGSPVASPTSSPVASPTSSPVAGPTKAPIDPSPLPTEAPIDPPTKSPTGQPSVSPSMAPIPASPTPGTGIPFPCCGWNGGCEQPDNAWCHAAESQCTGACNGSWYTGDGGPAPSPSPGGSGCCTWGGWSECPSWTVGSSDACQQNAASCEQTCSGYWIYETRRKLRGDSKKQ
eukprot:CAMPEP_0194065916 /NCGR_PEP_ID=MMETSP0009_2-20130614/85733_1 /TAXON_ID=210454 /ORGANISM="Grammatophora oceanica, Strain CCMP 410" /LENGTH=1128 /DNA_ID=CAMNT_0038718813 /DNA_START=91 /DNA_END=3477 /DNA_ORIENTATION=+